MNKKFQILFIFYFVVFSNDCFGQNIDSLHADFLNKYKNSNYEEAILVCKKIIQIDSLNYSAYNNLSKTYHSIGQFESAIIISNKMEDLFSDSLQKTLSRTSSRLSTIYIENAIAYFAIQEYDKTIEYSKKMIDNRYVIDHDENYFLMYFGLIYKSNPKKFPLELLELMHSIGPKTSWYKLQLSKKYWQNRNYIKSPIYYIKFLFLKYLYDM